MGTDPVVEGVVAVIFEEASCTAGALVGGARRILAIRRAQHIRAGGFWCFPGGGIEPGETAEEALVREIHEELALSVRPVRKVWEWLRPEGGLRLHWWLAESLEELARAVPNPDEVAEARLVSLEEFRCLNPVLESNLRFLEHYERTCESA